MPTASQLMSPAEKSGTPRPGSGASANAASTQRIPTRIPAAIIDLRKALVEAISNVRIPCRPGLSGGGVIAQAPPDETFAILRRLLGTRRRFRIARGAAMNGPGPFPTIGGDGFDVDAVRAEGQCRRPVSRDVEAVQHQLLAAAGTADRNGADDHLGPRAIIHQRRRAQRQCYDAMIFRLGHTAQLVAMGPYARGRDVA